MAARIDYVSNYMGMVKDAVTAAPPSQGQNLLRLVKALDSPGAADDSDRDPYRAISTVIAKSGLSRHAVLRSLVLLEKLGAAEVVRDASGLPAQARLLDPAAIKRSTRVRVQVADPSSDRSAG